MQRWIIMVDDDLDMHFIYQKVFERLGVGHRLKLLESGGEALEFLWDHAGEVQLIFSDINMPVMDGLQLRREILNHQLRACATIPFVFLSTSAQEKEVKAAYELLVQGVFQKGNSIDDLCRVISIVLDYWDTCRMPEPCGSSSGWK